MTTEGTCVFGQFAIDDHAQVVTGTPKVTVVLNAVLKQPDLLSRAGLRGRQPYRPSRHERGRWPWFFALTDDGRMLVASNMSDSIDIFDTDPDGRLHASDQVAVRRPVFIAPVSVKTRLFRTGSWRLPAVHAVRDQVVHAGAMSYALT
jgi:hypothetical protein